jgi:acyl-CoA-binding protein
MLGKIGVLLGLIITLATVFGLGYGVETHFAKAEHTSASFEEVTVTFDEVRQDIQKVSTRIDAMKLEDELILVKKKIARIEDRWGKVFYDRFERYWQTIEELKGVMPEDYREEYQEAQDEKVRLEKLIEDKNKTKEEGEQ